MFPLKDKEVHGKVQTYKIFQIPSLDKALGLDNKPFPKTS